MMLSPEFVGFHRGIAGVLLFICKKFGLSKVLIL